MVQKILLAVLLASVAVPAMAADMPVKAPPQYAPPVSDWTGFYFGFHGGYGWGTATPDDVSASDLVDTFHNPKPKGFVFGGQAGYLWQYNRFVGGLEVDYSVARLKDDQSATESGQCGDVTCSFTLSLNTKVDALASARARAGFLLGDSLYLYGTAGAGWGHSAATIAITECVGTRCETAATSAKSNNFGWVAGGGLEWKIMQNISLRGEYLHYDFGSVGYAFSPIGTVNAKLTVDVARGALNFRF